MCLQPADRERDGEPFCAKCLAEIEALEQPPPEPIEVVVIPGLVTIKRYK